MMIFGMMIFGMMITHKEYKIGEKNQIFEDIWYEPIHSAVRLLNSISGIMQKLNSLMYKSQILKALDAT